MHHPSPPSSLIHTSEYEMKTIHLNISFTAVFHRALRVRSVRSFERVGDKTVLKLSWRMKSRKFSMSMKEWKFYVWVIKRVSLLQPLPNSSNLIRFEWWKCSLSEARWWRSSSKIIFPRIVSESHRIATENFRKPPIIVLNHTLSR